MLHTICNLQAICRYNTYYYIALFSVWKLKDLYKKKSFLLYCTNVHKFAKQTGPHRNCGKTENLIVKSKLRTRKRKIFHIFKRTAGNWEKILFVFEFVLIFAMQYFYFHFFKIFFWFCVWHILLWCIFLI